MKGALKLAKYKYAVLEHDESLENAVEFETLNTTPEFVAERAAEHEHGCRDGWECSWPLTFQIWDEDDNDLGTFLVDRRHVPEFEAEKVR